MGFTSLTFKADLPDLFFVKISSILVKKPYPRSDIKRSFWSAGPAMTPLKLEPEGALIFPETGSPCPLADGNL